MKKNELDKILKLHAKWLNEQDGGVEADLSRTDLRMADLRRADLRGADIDFSCWPLWCGSLDVKLDNRQKRQLLYHVLAVCPEYRTKELVAEANKFHRVGEVPELTINEVIK